MHYRLPVEFMEAVNGATKRITMPDGTTIYFGNSEPSEANNPWLADIEKATKQ